MWMTSYEAKLQRLIVVCVALRHKSWSYYEDWKLVFEKDRTTSLGAKDNADATNEVGSQSRANNVEAYENNHNFAEYFEQEGNPDGVLHEETTESVQYSTVGVVGKKRKGRDALDGLVEVIRKMHEDTNARL
ncbi:hypothetical protein SASPL_135340 [Salvia splendens]|uniref:Uncharacterized protein n=1 Tax=Salvia splendens TaxID=180675 RepID=A0A8X8ZFV9_SALSN|nr:hypothetical protein SASPL_135340 [Salvia splendens]